MNKSVSFRRLQRQSYQHVVGVLPACSPGNAVRTGTHSGRKPSATIIQKTNSLNLESNI